MPLRQNQGFIVQITLVHSKQDRFAVCFTPLFSLVHCRVKVCFPVFYKGHISFFIQERKCHNILMFTLNRNLIFFSSGSSDLSAFQICNSFRFRLYILHLLKSPKSFLFSSLVVCIYVFSQAEIIKISGKRNYISRNRTGGPETFKLSGNQANRKCPFVSIFAASAIRAGQKLEFIPSLFGLDAGSSGEFIGIFFLKFIIFHYSSLHKSIGFSAGSSAVTSTRSSGSLI